MTGYVIKRFYNRGNLQLKKSLNRDAKICIQRNADGKRCGEHTNHLNPNYARKKIKIAIQ